MVVAWLAHAPPTPMWTGVGVQAAEASMAVCGWIGTEGGLGRQGDAVSRWRPGFDCTQPVLSR